ncbi:hypothetical protein BGZ47_010039, partial [Haplosporangium gracile]
ERLQVIAPPAVQPHSEDEANEEENGDKTVLAQPDEVEEEQEDEDNKIMNNEEEGEVVVDMDEEEEEEEEEEKLYITPAHTRHSLRLNKAKETYNAFAIPVIVPGNNRNVSLKFLKML